MAKATLRLVEEIELLSTADALHWLPYARLPGPWLLGLVSRFLRCLSLLPHSLGRTRQWVFFVGLLYRCGDAGDELVDARLQSFTIPGVPKIQLL